MNEVNELLYTTCDYIQKLYKSTNEVKELFNEQTKQAEAYKLAADMVEGLLWVVSSVESLEPYCKGDFRSDELETLLKELPDAQKSNDIVLMSDLFEYELAPLLEKWYTILCDNLKEKIEQE
ncbi:MAG: hypothetical protein ACRCSG_02605 [Cellulosilyticaceae bacterium]